MKLFAYLYIQSPFWDGTVSSVKLAEIIALSFFELICTHDFYRGSANRIFNRDLGTLNDIQSNINSFSINCNIIKLVIVSVKILVSCILVKVQRQNLDFICYSRTCNYIICLKVKQDLKRTRSYNTDWRHVTRRRFQAILHIP